MWCFSPIGTFFLKNPFCVGLLVVGQFIATNQAKGNPLLFDANINVHSFLNGKGLFGAELFWC